MIAFGAMPKLRSDDQSYNFIAPGATPRTRWNTKAILLLKIKLFREQFKLIRNEKSALKA